MVELKAILKTLNTKKIPFVLVGAHAIGSYTGRPRATKNVDILVRAGRNHSRAVNAIKALYSSLEVRKVGWVTGFFRPGETESVIDVTMPYRRDNEESLKTAVWIEEDGIKYRVPTLEAALANKYGAMLSLGQDMVKRGMDAVDFAGMVKHSQDSGQKGIDRDKLEALGEMVWPGGGGSEILRLVDGVNEGKLPRVAGMQ